MARTPIIAGNWKMNDTVAAGVALVKELAPLVKAAKATVVVCPTAGRRLTAARRPPRSMSTH